MSLDDISASKRPRIASSMSSFAIFDAVAAVIAQTPVLSSIPSTASPRVPNGPNRETWVIGTHDGGFHCDEACAIGMLKCLPRFAASPVVRTRKEDILAQCDIVVDVGAKYLPESNLFDHHQREFTGTLEGYPTKLSSAGLVYKHYGKEILTELLGRMNTPADSAFLDILYHKVYVEFMEHIDAIDNGIAVAEGPLRYVVSTTLSARVGRLSPSWNESQTNEIMNDCFRRAVELTCSEFVGYVRSLVASWWPARFIVQEAMKARKDAHPSGQILFMPTACPWKDHLFEVEKEMSCVGELLYVVFGDTGGSFRVQAVPTDPHAFGQRKGLPEAWRGLRDGTLSDKISLPGCIFVHASGFIGGHQTQEGAMAMAAMALTV